MSNDLTIRKAHEADAGLIGRLYTESPVTGMAGLSEAYVQQQRVTLSATEGFYLFEKANEAIGWGAIRKYSDRGGYRFCAEVLAGILPTEQGKGYGFYLADRLLDQCRQWKYHHLIARLAARDTAALSLAKNLGYTIVGVQKEILNIDGSWEDVVVLQCLL